MHVTIKDVAKEANVSPSTVSRVLSGSSKISDETKNIVMKSVKKLNYHPNAIARSLAHSSTKILALILPSAAESFHKNPFYIQLMSGIGVYAQEKNYNIMYSFGRDEKEELECIKKFIESRLVDGIILFTSRNNDKCIEYLKDKNFPFSVVGRPECTDGIMWVDNDNFKAMYDVTDKVINRGHKNIAFIGGPRDWNVSIDRLDGFKKAMQTHCIKPHESFIIHTKGFNEQSGYDAMLQILSLDEIQPTVVITTDDLIAFGAIRAINENNSSSNITVVGFNNTAFAAYQNPPLSSVEINPYKLGYYSAKLLIHKLKNVKMMTNHFIVETNFIERGNLKSQNTL